MTEEWKLPRLQYDIMKSLYYRFINNRGNPITFTFKCFRDYFVDQYPNRHKTYLSSFQSLSRAMNKLARKGLVNKERDGINRICYCLTDEGMEYCDKNNFPLFVPDCFSSIEEYHSYISPLEQKLMEGD